MPKVVITGDSHWGVPGRLEDTTWAMRTVSEYAYRNDIGTIILLGDMFHDRKSTGIDVMCAAHDFFDGCRKRNQKYITFPGNHDMFLKHSWSVNSLRQLRDVVTVVDTVSIIKLDDVRFWVLPFIHFENAYMRVARRIYEQYSAGDVLLTHVGTTGAIKNVCFLLRDWSIVSFHDSPFKQIYTGHFHTHQQVGHNVWYPGSPIPFKFDEGDCQHGFLVYDLDTRQHEFVDILEVGPQYFPDETPPPNYFTIPEEMVGDLPRSVADNNNLRVATSREYTPNERRQVDEHLRALGARSVRWLNVSADNQYDDVRRKHWESGDRDVFEMWLEIDKGNIGDLNVDLLRRFNSEIAHEADEIYNYEGDDD